MREPTGEGISDFIGMLGKDDQCIVHKLQVQPIALLPPGGAQRAHRQVDNAPATDSYFAEQSATHCRPLTRAAFLQRTIPCFIAYRVEPLPPIRKVALVAQGTLERRSHLHGPKALR